MDNDNGLSKLVNQYKVYALRVVDCAQILIPQDKVSK